MEDVHQHQLDINNNNNNQPVVEVIKDELYYVELLKAINAGDWGTAKRIFDSDPSSLTADVTGMQETPLHLAINSSRSTEFIRRLVDLLPQAAVEATNKYGGTVLHNAAIVGNVEAARILVQKSPGLLQVKNRTVGDAPVTAAARYCSHRAIVSYLLSATLDQEDGGGLITTSSPLRGKDGARLLNLLISDDFYGIAIELLSKFPALAREEVDDTTAIATLAKRPQVFPSGTRIGHCRRLWNRCKPWSSLKLFKAENPPTNRKEHKQAMQLLKLLISEILKAATGKEVDRLLSTAITTAAKLGISEIVTEIVKAYPSAIWLWDGKGSCIFHLAVIYRKEKVFNIMYQMSANKTFAAALLDVSTGNNLLHMAAMLGPTETIPGAALKVQRELQWFDEVEKMVQPTYREKKNKEEKTPRELFTEEHRSLIEQGEKWMKETANSCSLVAALVVTVAFAAAFTLPGGTKDNGSPNYLNKPSLMVFMAADTLALFSSSTSLLMFLGILTSRYSERDFLRSLPIKMGVGLLTLFLSIAAMLIAFGASLHVVLYHNVNWIMAPIGLVASVPALLFVFLQFPLLVELLFSTFGPSIFGKQSDEIIY